jgi:uncharacterized protein
MIVHINQIPVEGLHLEGEEPAKLLELAEPGMRPVGPVGYSLDVGLSGTGLFATGRLWVPMEMDCVRCLRTFQREIRVDPFAFQMELPGPETVDLTPFVREDMVLALPPHPHCDWDGKNVCPGVRLEAAGDEGPEVRPGTWDALDQLKLEENE